MDESWGLAASPYPRGNMKGEQERQADLALSFDDGNSPKLLAEIAFHVETGHATANSTVAPPYSILRSCYVQGSSAAAPAFGSVR